MSKQGPTRPSRAASPALSTAIQDHRELHPVLQAVYLADPDAWTIENGTTLIQRERTIAEESPVPADVDAEEWATFQAWKAKRTPKAAPVKAAPVKAAPAAPAFGPFECSTCRRTFKTPRGLDGHAGRCGMPGTLVCPGCRVVFQTPQGLGRHKNSCTGPSEAPDPTECPRCHITSKTAKGLRRHLMFCQGIVGLECPTCRRTFTAKQGLTNHMKNCGVEVGTPCPRCRKLFSSMSGVRLHMLRAHQEPITNLAILALLRAGRPSSEAIATATAPQGAQKPVKAPPGLEFAAGVARKAAAASADVAALIAREAQEESEEELQDPEEVFEVEGLTQPARSLQGLTKHEVLEAVRNGLPVGVKAYWGEIEASHWAGDYEMIAATLRNPDRVEFDPARAGRAVTYASLVFVRGDLAVIAGFRNPNFPLVLRVNHRSQLNAISRQRRMVAGASGIRS